MSSSHRPRHQADHAYAQVGEDEIIGFIRAYIDTLFPKTCPQCGRTYENLREYVMGTTPVGEAISYDLELGELSPERPVGAIALAQCPCGKSLALATTDRKVSDVHFVLKWVRAEAERRGQAIPELINDIRMKIRQQAMEA